MPGKHLVQKVVEIYVYTLTVVFGHPGFYFFGHCITFSTPERRVDDKRAGCIRVYLHRLLYCSVSYSQGVVRHYHSAHTVRRGGVHVQLFTAGCYMDVFFFHALVALSLHDRRMFTVYLPGDCIQST